VGQPFQAFQPVNVGSRKFGVQENMSQSAEYFNEKFWTSTEKGVHRAPGDARYAVTARQLAHAFADLRSRSGSNPWVLEVGCGQGAVMEHLDESTNWMLDGFDLSEWAVKNPVHHAVFLGDLNNARMWWSPRELVYCIGVLEFLEPDEVLAALQRIRSWSHQYVALGLQPTDQRYMPRSYLLDSGRRTFENTRWWEDKITGAGLVIDHSMTEKLYDGVIGWDGMYVCRS